MRAPSHAGSTLTDSISVTAFHRTPHARVGEHNAQMLKIAHLCGLCAQASLGDCGHIAWAASKFTPNVFVKERTN